MTAKLYSRLAAKNITVAVTGGIAAYKTCELVRLLVKSGTTVRVCMTQAATEFVGPLTFAALSGHPVQTEAFDGTMQHLALTRNCDLLIVAPATANILAMNSNMWARASTQRNIAQLKADGFAVLGPACGELACGVSGAGRMIEPEEIAAHAARLLSPKILQGKRFVVTAGPTFEALDPVRGITNRSSGKQGYAVAQAAFEAGANVTLISGPTSIAAPYGVKAVPVVSAEEMNEAVHREAPGADVFVSVAAVSDWRAQAVADEKIKKSDEPPALDLVENPDILAQAAREFPSLYCVGFAAETENVLENARGKRIRKLARMIVANNARSAIGCDMNEAVIVTADKELATGLVSKDVLAQTIIECIADDLAKEV